MKIFKGLKITGPKNKKTLGLIILAFALAAASFVVLGNRNGGEAAQEEILYTLAKGDIEIAITGSGTVYSADSQELDPDEFEAEVQAIYFQEGDSVEQGDLIYELKSETLAAEWARAKIAYENAALEYRMASGDMKDLTVRSPITGVVESLDIEAGETLVSGATVATIRDKEEVYIKASFNLAHEGKIKEGQSAVATFPSSFAVYQGKVASVESTPASDGKGGLFLVAYIAIDNPGGLLEGEQAAIVVHTGTETVRAYKEGVLEYKDPYVLESPGKTTVLKVLKKINDPVKAGETIAILESDSLQIESTNRNISLQEAKIELDELSEQVESLRVRAEIGGILAGQDVSIGDSVGIKNGNSDNAASASGVLGKVISLDKRITIAVDELDINKVSIGQKAQVTVDAAPGEIFEGAVVKISELGEVQNGVATYDVTVSVPYSKLVREGMSADGEILIASKTGVVLLPIEAVTEMGKRKMAAVYREGDGEKTMVPVETGLMDARFYEVVSGLAEGDQVVMTGLAGSSTISTARTGGMLPGMGGGRPNGN